MMLLLAVVSTLIRINTVYRFIVTSCAVSFIFSLSINFCPKEEALCGTDIIRILHSFQISTIPLPSQEEFHTKPTQNLDAVTAIELIMKPATEMLSM